MNADRSETETHCGRSGRTTASQVADLQAVLEVSRQLGATTDLERLLRQIEQSARRVLGCERATVFLLDAEQNELYSRIATGVNEIRIPTDRGIAGEVFRTKRAVNVPDAYVDVRFNRTIDEKTGYRTRNLLAFPLLGLDGSCVGVLQVLNKRDSAFTDWDEQLVETLGAQVGVAIQRQLLLEEFVRKQRLEHDLQIARRIQQKVLPARPPPCAGYDIAGWNRPADETGGDFFDFQALADGQIGITIADATGHGIGPALVAAECRALLRAALSLTRDLDDVVGLVNRLISADMPDGRFVTAFFGLLDPAADRLTHISAGQGPLLLYDAARDEVIELAVRGIPLGILGDRPYGPVEVTRFRPGDGLVLLTDGFYEWCDQAGEMVGVQRIREVVRQTHDRGSREIIAELCRTVNRFTGGTPQADDLTAVVVRKL